MEIKSCNVWSVFPLCGKTYSSNKDGIDAIDSDSSSYSWIEINGKKERNPDFPKNYIRHIKDVMINHDYVFVSSHQEVRNALSQEGISFNLVYPHRNCLDEWINRYKNREYNGFSLQVLIDNWEKWLNELDSQNCERRIILNENEFLIDKL